MKTEEEVTCTDQNSNQATVPCSGHALPEACEDTGDRILIVGHTGNGKSTLGNTLLGGRKEFPVGYGLYSTTLEPASATGKVLGRNVKVIDTPDLSNAAFTGNTEKEEMISQIKELTRPSPTAIVLVVRSDVIYTIGQHNAYREIKRLWGDEDDFRRKLLVVFTFGDTNENFNREKKELKEVNLLKDVLKDAHERYVQVDKQAKAEQMEAFLAKLDEIKRVHECGGKAEMNMARAVDNRDETRILIIGKTGNGKSSIGNIITGDKNAFTVGAGLYSTTTEPSCVRATVKDRHIKVVDTPDISELSREEKMGKISKWKDMTSCAPDAILLAVRCDIRYTLEESAIYTELKKLWGDDEQFRNALVVAFTFGDRQDGDLDQQLKTVCKELKNVLKDADNRYVMFNNKQPADEQLKSAEQLLSIIQKKDSFIENGWLLVKRPRYQET